MNRKVAFFASGWNAENVYNYISGMWNELEGKNIDIFTFLGHATYASSDEEGKSDCMIYELPDLKTFDAAVVFTSSLDYKSLSDSIFAKCNEAGIPTISLGAKRDGAYSLEVDNEVGMKALVRHLIKDHNVRKIAYMAGSEDNRDSETRKRVIENVMKENDLKFSSDDVYYTNWEDPVVERLTIEVCKDASKRPDAIVCANDLLAEYASIALDSLELSCPDDVIITGFDHLREGQLFYPSISSVEQHYYELGGETAKTILDLFEGKEPQKERVFACEFIHGESCGCAKVNTSLELRRAYTRGIPTKRRIDTYIAGRLGAMEKSLLDSEQFSNLPDALRKLFYSSHGREGKTFAIMLDPNFSNLAYEKLENQVSHNLEDDMLVLVAKMDGTPVDERFCSREKLIPGYTGEGDSHIYVLMSIYLQSYFCGYMVMQDHLDYFLNMTFYEFMKRFNRGLENYRKSIQLNALNAKLQELMQKDGLTSVRNRHAYENSIASLKEKYSLGDRTPFAVIMFDVNNLKKINDELGHECGDDYLKNSCKMICESFKHSPVYRIGGDEFVTIVSNADYEIRYNLLEKFRQSVKDASEDDSRSIVCRVSIASGMADYEEIEIGGFESIFKRADERMYENKRTMKGDSIR